MNEKLHIVKIGGKLLDTPENMDVFLKRFTSIEGIKILVHGGGNKTTELTEKLGMEVTMIDGRRVTKKNDLDVAVMVYAGLANKKMVADLQFMGCNALGLTGADLNLIQAIKRLSEPIDYGLVGDVEESSIDTVGLKRLLQMGITPVFCAITHDKSGQLLNTNADTIAAVLSQALSQDFEVYLHYCFEQQGVLNENKELIPVLTYEDFKVMRSNGVIRDGMIPKLTNAFKALDTGVKEVNVEQATELCNAAGTKLMAN